MCFYIAIANLNENIKRELSKAVPSFTFMDFSLLSPLEFFVDPKNVDGRNN